MFANAVLKGVTLVRNALQSQGFITGVQGFNLQRNGDAEFNNAVIRGATVAGDFETGDGWQMLAAAPAILQTWYSANRGVSIGACEVWTLINGTYMYRLNGSHGPVPLISIYAEGIVSGNSTVVLETRFYTMTGAVGPIANTEVRNANAAAGTAAVSWQNTIVAITGDESVPGGFDLQLGVAARSADRGVVIEDVETSVSPAAGTAAPVAIATVEFDALPHRFYRLEFGDRVESSIAAGGARFSVHQTSAAGALVSDFGTVPCTNTGTDYAAQGWAYVGNYSSAVKSSLVLVLALQQLGASGTVDVPASSARPRYFRVRDVGSTDDNAGYTAL